MTSHELWAARFRRVFPVTTDPLLVRALIVVTLLVNFNLSALLMEVFWVLISFVGIYRYFRLKAASS